MRPHTRESLALRLTDNDGVSIVYTSDTGYSEELAQFARDAELLILECSFDLSVGSKSESDG